MAHTGKADSGTVQRSQSPTLPFLLGAVVGGLTGALIGAVLGRHSGDAMSTLINTVDKRAGRDPQERPRFELLLQ